MITKISGKLVRLHLDAAVIESPPFEYEVLIPEFTRRQLQQEIGKPVSLHTIHYMDGNPQMGKQVPRLIGFLTEVEREFFDLFCSVDGIGTRKALRAMLRPVREVAAAIEEQDVKFLASLPGIGQAMGERVVAKLRRKVPKFALMVARDLPDAESQTDLVLETFEALLTLGHNEADARRLIDSVIATKKKFKDSAELIQAIYQNNK
ncbi:MAG TPA: Holliday junction DNA helicase RuvA [Planctomycetaceae bacterium]|nr:Holliday junction DNA helicase RuvA [Planctomycetaceae bacterium]